MTHRSATPPKLTVVVVARNEERRIAACIGSIAAQDYPNFSVILVDDGSTDATVAIARRALPGIRVISSPTRSISRNRDAGWRAADSEYVAFLDADCEAPNNWLTSLVDAAIETGAAAVGGGNRPPAGESDHYDALAIMMQTFAGSRGSLQGKLPKEGKYVGHLPGLNVLYRTEALKLVGGYDPRFARMGEDEDLSHRLIGLGLRLYVTPDATVIHCQRDDLASWARNMRAYGRGRTWLLRRHPNALSPFFLLPPMMIALLPIYLPLIAIYSGWVSLRAGRFDLVPRLFLLFAFTHLAYGLGQVEGLFIRGDNDAALEKRDRIALIALKNAGNKGDEAISACVSERIIDGLSRSAAPVDVYLAALGPSGFDLRPLPTDATARDMLIADMLAPTSKSRDVGDGTFAAFPSLLAMLIRFRAIMIAGGQWLHDLSFAKHVAICGLFAAARMFRTKTAVFCIGAGPLRSTLSRYLLRVAFSRRSLLVTRDEASTALLRSCGLAQAQTATDPAIDLATTDISCSGGRILISPCAWASFDNLYALDTDEVDASLSSWRRLVAQLQGRGERVAILPTMNPEDASFADRIADGFEDVEVIDTDSLIPAQVQGYIASARALVSMRLHPIIFASNVRTPFVALTYAVKVRAYCEQAGFGARIVSIHDADWPEKVLKKLDTRVDPAGVSEARVRQEELLAKGYSQFFNWLRLGSAPEPKALKQAAQLS